MMKQALIRGSIPFAIMSFIAFVLYLQRQMEDARGTFFTAMIVGVIGATSVIYDLDHWSLFKRSMVHFLSMLLTVYPILLISGWFRLETVRDYVNVFLLFIAIGGALWLVNLFIIKVILNK